MHKMCVFMQTTRYCAGVAVFFEIEKCVLLHEYQVIKHVYTHFRKY